MTVRSSGDAVHVVGMDDFRRSLKAAGAEFPRMLGKANKAAADVVAQQAKSNASSLGSTARHVAPSIKSSAAAAQAKVTLGDGGYPMALGAEFGSDKFHQFRPWRGNQWQPDEGGVGYFLHPAVRETREQFMDVYDKAVVDITRLAFPL